MFKRLFFGELSRLKKYHVTYVSFFVILMWSALFYFIEDAALLLAILPFIVLMDISVMPLMYAGAVLFFEKTESTSFSLLVTPVKHASLIWSKVFANVFHQLISTSCVLFVFTLIKGIPIPFLPLLVVMVFSIILYTLLGFSFTYRSKEFTSMLTLVMIALILCSIPTFLISFNILNVSEWFSYLLLINPFEATLRAIDAALSSVYDAKSVLSIVSMTGWVFILYLWDVKPHFIRFIQKGSGI